MDDIAKKNPDFNKIIDIKWTMINLE
jgi:hypothetical protein